MTVETKKISLSTKGNTHIVDITSDIESTLKGLEMSDGIVTVFVPGATGALTTVEYEPGLVSDLTELFDRIIPQDKEYQHNLRWHDGNGHSHVRASLLGPSLTIPFCSRELMTGTWQQVVFIDFDVRSRHREIILQCIGE